MMVPDYRLIAEVQLYAAGFQSAASLAAHLVSVLKVRTWVMHKNTEAACDACRGTRGGNVQALWAHA